jgi:hypothetical protein
MSPSEGREGDTPSGSGIVFSTNSKYTFPYALKLRGGGKRKRRRREEERGERRREERGERRREEGSFGHRRRG